MPDPERVLLSWSGGKDSALALQEALRQGGLEIVLFTTVTEGYDRISMHGVRQELLEAQAASLGLALRKVRIPSRCPDGEYARIMKESMEGHYSQGYRKVIFGDIFLEDVRKYREENLGKVGMEAVFPLWGKDSRDLAGAFIESGFKAITTCVDSQVLGKDFAGREYTDRFLEDLPPGADPCGENGEFHTFVYGGPIFTREVPFSLGEIVLRDNRFFYCDLIGK